MQARASLPTATSCRSRRGGAAGDPTEEWIDDSRAYSLFRGPLPAWEKARAAPHKNELNVIAEEMSSPYSIGPMEDRLSGSTEPG